MSLRRIPAPVESPQARHALVTAYKALLVLQESGLIDYIGEADSKAAEQARDAIEQIELSMSPNLLATVLPAYTEVLFSTRESGGMTTTGMLREGAWGLYPDRGQQSLERRITTTGPHGGWEFFVTPDTEFTHFDFITKQAS